MYDRKEENVAIYRVSKGIDTTRRFFEINLEKSAIFPRYIAGQRSQGATVKVKCATVSRYSAPPQTNCLRGDLNPKPKDLGFSFLPFGPTLPYDIKCIKHIYT